MATLFGVEVHMFRMTTRLFFVFAASAMMARGTVLVCPSAPSPIMNLPIDDGDPYQTGDGPCYDAARKCLNDCMAAAKAAGSVAAGESCRLAYAAQVSACDQQMGN